MSDASGFQPPRLAPLPYQVPAENRRPGMLTAVAIISIVIAGFSALFSLSSILSGAMMFVVSKTRMPMPVTPPVTTTFATTTTTGPTGITTTTTTVASAPFQVDAAALILTATGGVLSLFAASVLLAAGIQVLRDRRGGNRLHWIFIAIKVPVTLLIAVATYLMTSSMMRNIHIHNTAPPGGLNNSYIDLMVTAQMVITLVMSLAYPVTLVFLLRSRTARNYFASLTE